MDFLGLTVLLKGPGVLWDLFSLNFVNYGFSWFAFTTLNWTDQPAIMMEIKNKLPSNCFSQLIEIINVYQTFKKV